MHLNSNSPEFKHESETTIIRANRFTPGAGNSISFGGSWSPRAVGQIREWLGQVRGLHRLRELVSSGQDGRARCHHSNDIRNSLWVGFARRLPNTLRCAGQRRLANAILRSPCSRVTRSLPFTTRFLLRPLGRSRWRPSLLQREVPCKIARSSAA